MQFAFLLLPRLKMSKSWLIRVGFLQHPPGVWHQRYRTEIRELCWGWRGSWWRGKENISISCLLLYISSLKSLPTQTIQWFCDIMFFFSCWGSIREEDIPGMGRDRNSPQDIWTGAPPNPFFRNFRIVLSLPPFSSHCPKSWCVGWETGGVFVPQKLFSEILGNFCLSFPLTNALAQLQGRQ